MEKLFEKKNLGIPVVLLTMLAYVIGYFMTNNYVAVLPAIIFAGAVFALNFDEKVKTAVKQSFFIAIVLTLVYFLLNILSEVINIVDKIAFLSSFLNKAYNLAASLFNILVIVVFLLLIITAIFGKDIKIDFILNLLGEGTPKKQPTPSVNQPFQGQNPGQPYPQPVPQPNYQQPVTPITAQPYIQQPVAPITAQPYIQQPVTPITAQSYIQPPIVQPQGEKPLEAVCTKCGTHNRAGASFCASCGSKL